MPLRTYRNYSIPTGKHAFCIIGKLIQKQLGNTCGMHAGTGFPWQRQIHRTQITVLSRHNSAMPRNGVFPLINTDSRWAKSGVGNTVNSSVKLMRMRCFHPNAAAFPLQMAGIRARPWAHPGNVVFPGENSHSAASGMSLQNS